MISFNKNINEINSSPNISTEMETQRQKSGRIVIKQNFDVIFHIQKRVKQNGMYTVNTRKSDYWSKEEVSLINLMCGSDVGSMTAEAERK